MMSFENGKRTALRIVVNGVKSKILFEPIHNVSNGLQAETSVSCK